MYMEMKQRNRVSPVPYLLVKPTEAEMHTLSTDVRSNRIAAFFFISAFAWMITVALLTAPFGFDNQSYVHLAILLVAFVVPIVILMTIAIRFSDRVTRMLEKMEKESRAFELRWRGLLGYGDVGNALMRRVLFSGDRLLLLEHMREVIQDLKPAVLDQFLVHPGNVELLRLLSNARTEVERDEYTSLLVQRAQQVIVAIEPRIAYYQALEAAQREEDSVRAADQEAAGRRRVEQYICSMAAA